jgi:hypothetical protein
MSHPWAAELHKTPSRRGLVVRFLPVSQSAVNSIMRTGTGSQATTCPRGHSRRAIEDQLRVGESRTGRRASTRQACLSQVVHEMLRICTIDDPDYF